MAAKSKLNAERVIRAVERDENSGFCLACGFKQDCVEPDARGYKCESCGEMKVYGAEECLMEL